MTSECVPSFMEYDEHRGPSRDGSRGVFAHDRDRLPGHQSGESGRVYLVVARRVLRALRRLGAAVDRAAPGGEPFGARSLRRRQAVVPRSVGGPGFLDEPGWEGTGPLRAGL